MAFKIYTKTGDKGQTGLYGGLRISKDHIRIEAYGTIDELNSHIGLIRDSINVHENYLIEKLTGIQAVLFDMGSHLAAQPDKKLNLPDVDIDLVNKLENIIDKLDESIKPLKTFILPGGNAVISQIHITRCVCRRAERRVVTLGNHEPINETIIPFLNRLSDLLFTLARYVAAIHHIEEIPWVAGQHKL